MCRPLEFVHVDEKIVMCRVLVWVELHFISQTQSKLYFKEQSTGCVRSKDWRTLLREKPHVPT